MASNRSWTNICSDCGNYVEILNGDFEFSMTLHKQSHKSLDSINQGLDCTQEKTGESSRFNTEYCNECKEHITIINNDVSLSLMLHAQQHKSSKPDVLSNHSSTSSKKRRRYKNKQQAKEKAQATPVLPSFMEAIFKKMPTGLKAHQGFISERDCSTAFCNLCEILIDPIFTVTEHLKTKLHEDNTIQVIKVLLPSELQGQMQFISFYDSNLCCNLCSCEIQLCSNNLHETVVNIFAHNAGKVHSNKTFNMSESHQSDKASVVLRTLALMDPLVKENEDFIEHKMTPNYKCKLCDKAIQYKENRMELLNSFKCHFGSPDHKKFSGTVSVLNKWNGINISGKENHKFVVSKQNIYCLACSCFVESKVEQLLAHVKINSSLTRNNQIVSIPHMESTNSPNNDHNNVPSSSKWEHVQRVGITNQLELRKQNLPASTKSAKIFNKDDVKAQFNELLQTNERIKWNSKYLVQIDDGYTCRLCKKNMKVDGDLKIFESNLMSHITGKQHNKKITKEFCDILDQLQLSCAEIKTNREFLMKKDQKVWCALCECEVPSTENVDGLMQNLLIHLTGTSHIKKRTATENSKDDPSVNNPESGKLHPQDPIRRLFDKLPDTYAEDMEFISLSPIKGGLECRLCNSTIHPNYLKEHLEDLLHVQRRVEVKRHLLGSECITNNQNMATLSSLLHKIDIKSPW